MMTPLIINCFPLKVRKIEALLLSHSEKLLETLFGCWESGQILHALIWEVIPSRQNYPLTIKECNFEI